MNVKLISYSQLAKHPMTISELDTGNFDELQNLIAFCARVSNPSNQMNTETAEKLIRYLAKHKHWSPFELVSVCLEIETNRDIARQMLRHRSFSFQEFSQRYADPTKDLEFVTRDARLQDEKNRQNSIPTDDEALKQVWDTWQRNVCDQALLAYRWAIENGIAKEQARAVLPEGLTMSRMYMNGTLRSWMHYIELRSGHGTQLEHIEIAKACADVISKVFPMITEYVEGE